ncbi:aminomethyl-transferring glycine dehydrogenase subunit GcvPA [Alkalimarinus sediminis]|uniref:Probable glycine dehydrogenase (decarboxylating) subunit 1 n=1 Tax=Alkalimarinus sediminis TaxID=1632866 RepID=A0A9E8KPY9_9ALTE|nr:aminomethyl-transferring glycine dehydrogenase subunit GcvPA [Alkalimarinus sediminis]UZW74047.1 aminomethyl-transferring glycine dehydrogenase subunit GcvPA [Alkalimarinus sediminis]
MPFIPHTEEDIQKMLETIGAQSIDQLFDEIPTHLRAGALDAIPPARSEMEIMRLMSDRAEQDSGALCFIGAGAYEHHIPAAVWDIATRGEFMTAYTPYQAEASQGTLQLIYEFQSMMTALTGLDVSNASLYDGASGLAEAVLMAIRANRKSKSKRVLIAGTVHPLYKKVVNSIVHNQQIELVEVAFDSTSLTTDVSALAQYEGEDFAALIIAQPNFFGTLEDIHQLTDWAHQQKMLVIGVVNPTAASLISPPGEWGENGADIAVGEGQPMGIPLASGGPYFGFICCKQALVRQMPGRIIGRTVDLDGKEGFALTLQAREQHIRRSKATSNICTNQGLAVTAATIYMSLLGQEGIERVARACHANTNRLVGLLSAVPGVEVISTGPRFHEFVLRLPKSSRLVLEHMAVQGVLGGHDLSDTYPDLENCILVCVTETKTEQDLNGYVNALEVSLKELETVEC